MTTRSDLQRVVVRRLVPVVADLEVLVQRHGWFRVLGIAVTGLGLIGALGQVLGLVWLRLVFATLTGLVLVLASAVAFAAARDLRARLERSERLVHTYARALRATSPVSIREWRQEVTIAPDGGATFERRLVLNAATDDDMPRHLSVNLVYYGSSELSRRDKRRVTCTVFHREADGAGKGVRADATSVWTTSPTGRPRYELFVHLGTVVADGDVVTAEWDWPGYSADLMSGRSPEDFDVLFTVAVGRFEHSVVFRDIAHDSEFHVRNARAPGFSRTRRGRDVHVDFWAEDPPMHKRLGFTADYTRST